MPATDFLALAHVGLGAALLLSWLVVGAFTVAARGVRAVDNLLSAFGLSLDSLGDLQAVQEAVSFETLGRQWIGAVLEVQEESPLPLRLLGRLPPPLAVVLVLLAWPVLLHTLALLEQTFTRRLVAALLQEQTPAQLRLLRDHYLGYPSVVTALQDRDILEMLRDPGFVACAQRRLREDIPMEWTEYGQGAHNFSPVTVTIRVDREVTVTELELNADPEVLLRRFSVNGEARFVAQHAGLGGDLLDQDCHFLQSFKGTVLPAGSVLEFEARIPANKDMRVTLRGVGKWRPLH